MLKKMKVKVGYQKPEGAVKYGSGIKVAKLAAVMEFGDDQTPGRSYIRSTIEEKSAEIAAVEQREIGMVLAGKRTPTEAMSAIGSFVVGLIRTKLLTASAWAAPLADETVEAKGDATPLQETGLLAQALSWRVTLGKTELARGNR